MGVKFCTVPRFFSRNLTKTQIFGVIMRKTDISRSVFGKVMILGTNFRDFLSKPIEVATLLVMFLDFWVDFSVKNLDFWVLFWSFERHVPTFLISMSSPRRFTNLKTRFLFTNTVRTCHEETRLLKSGCQVSYESTKEN